MVGMSGSVSVRRGKVTAMTRTRPALARGTTVGAGSKKKSSCPPRSAVIIAGDPLKGTCSICVRVSMASSSAARWLMLPLPEEAPMPPKGTWNSLFTVCRIPAANPEPMTSPAGRATSVSNASSPTSTTATSPRVKPITRSVASSRCRSESEIRALL